MIYMFKIFDLKELKGFDVFEAMRMISNNSDVDEFQTVEEMEKFIKEEFDEGSSKLFCYVDDPEYFASVDLNKKTITRTVYTLRLETKILKSDEDIQKLIDAELAEDLKRGEALKKEISEYGGAQ